ncbi:peptidoglycan-binding protein [Streptomyces poriticola]|uniref:peptidoglycan-binding protein n=1 Tax=Streptomyces poriticola TaxID=3120506 RepID=UPI002FCDF519
MDRQQGSERALDPQVQRFVDRLRWLKDTHELSLAALGRRTGYSKSSWERYLNGKSLPPPEAVRELARLCRTGEDGLLVLRSLAEEAWNGAPPSAGPADGGPADEAEAARTAAESDGAAAAGTAEPTARRRGHRRTALAAAVGAGIVAVPGVVALLLSAADSSSADNRQVAESAYVFEPGRTYSCDIHREKGLLHAGSSDTTDAVLQQISTSWDVVEAQCLLEYRGYELGVVDGAYGAATERAVKRFQDRSGLVPDGIMGPHTWEALRR